MRRQYLDSGTVFYGWGVSFEVQPDGTYELKGFEDEALVEMPDGQYRVFIEGNNKPYIEVET